jgi:hypothetical protein
MESKQAIESMAVRRGIELPSPGCSGVLILLIAAVVGIVLLVGAWMMLR